MQFLQNEKIKTMLGIFHVVPLADNYRSRYHGHLVPEGS